MAERLHVGLIEDHKISHALREYPEDTRPSSTA